MKNHDLVKLNLAVTLLAVSQVAAAQSATELDITMRVIQEGQLPSGFIQQIELPPPEFFNQQDQFLDATRNVEISAEIQSDTTGLVDEVTDVATDIVRETISIDGTNPGNIGQSPISPVAELPSDIVNILDPALPLTNSLNDTLNQVGTGANSVLSDAVSITLPESLSADGDNATVELQDTSDLSTLLDIEADDIVDVFSNDVNADVDQLLNDSIDNLVNDGALPEVEAEVVEDITIGIDADLLDL